MTTRSFSSPLHRGVSNATTRQSLWQRCPPHFLPDPVKSARRSLPLSIRRISTSSQTAPKVSSWSSSHTPRTTPVRSSLLSNLRITLLTASVALTLTLGWYYVTDTRSGVHRLAPRVLKAVCPDAETSHEVGNAVLKVLWSLGVYPRERGRKGGGEGGEGLGLGVVVWDSLLDNPIAISAGLDKTASIPDALFALGASIVEVGGVTPLPQPGNEKPRVWRVTGEEGMVNRYGLNSLGADDMARQLRRRKIDLGITDNLTGGEEESERDASSVSVEVKNPGSLQEGKLLAINIAKNAKTDNDDTDAVIEDYVTCVNKLGPYADILVVNVSSPNTRGLRGLQTSKPLTRILNAVTTAASSIQSHKPKVIVKISPDEDSPEQIRGVCEAVVATSVDGVVVSNTTKSRPPPSALPSSSSSTILPQPGTEILRSATDARALAQEGGYSGPAMFPKTLELVEKYREALDEATVNGRRKKSGGGKRKVIFASGGIDDGKKVLQVLEAGASVAMMYTTLTYQGVGAVGRVKEEVRGELEAWREGRTEG
ncbi:uncharacterized protein KY384_003396 [Bacidia gigantensis]|uniref:uncharacterized protein n=1 Tax=Bacidia gigantensis TaxID=2732470 RepID=UPI001D03E774|nr:uncharacterized protein KY384_003396 [Bacidia gigantensis]KAG8531760.1 hypothetical protein KY384_003396 [Bacidia gigantensis]